MIPTESTFIDALIITSRITNWLTNGYRGLSACGIVFERDFVRIVDIT